MKTTLHHLPLAKQEQILEIVEIIREAAHPEKIILFGSYAKGKQVEHRYTGKDGISYESRGKSIFNSRGLSVSLIIRV